MISLADRIEGGLLGHLIGDALGVPYEFHGADELPPREHLEFEPPKGFRRAHASVPAGTWSDDGAQAMCLLATLLERGRLDLDDLGRRLLAWSDEGYMAVDGRVFDIGIQTSQALGKLREGAPANRSGRGDERANGNGSLMRVLPLALWHKGTDRELAMNAALQSVVTHGHPRSLACCALYCLWARRVLEEDAAPWASAVASFRSIYNVGEAIRDEAEAHVRPDEPPSGQGSGYVVDCLNSARLVIDAGSYEDVVKAAVALGNDTDTTACVAGGIAGIRDGIGAIPERWRTGLRGRDLVEPRLRGLLDVVEFLS
ncbi:MAG: ADP-ribosylglycohydrolase [Planctomycetota bacterium]|nr:ADP-ribosylglycohydrolase [Planctomycetota bacterium]